MSTSAEQLAADIVAAAESARREAIGMRSAAALGARKLRGEHVGRRSTLPPDVAQRIRDARTSGSSLQQIANNLNEDSTPTGQGGTKWYPSSVRAVLLSQSARPK